MARRWISSQFHQNTKNPSFFSALRENKWDNRRDTISWWYHVISLICVLSFACDVSNKQFYTMNINNILTTFIVFSFMRGMCLQLMMNGPRLSSIISYNSKKMLFIFWFSSTTLLSFQISWCLEQTDVKSRTASHHPTWKGSNVYFCNDLPSRYPPLRHLFLGPAALKIHDIST